MSSEKAVIRFLNGQQTTETLTNSTKYVTPAQRGGHYVVVERIGNTEVLAKDVVAIREGNNLHLLYADGQVVLSDFYSEGAQSSIDLPADTEDGVYTLDSNVRGSAGSEAGGVELLHVQGEGESLLQMAAERPYLFSEQGSSVEDDEEIETSSSSSSGGSSYIWLAGLGLAGQAVSFALASSDSSEGSGGSSELPTASITSVVNDTGDNLAEGSTTNDITPTLQGTLTSSLASNQKIQIYDGATYLGDATVSGTTWKYTDDRTHLDGAQRSYTAKITEGQNEGASSGVFSLIIDLSVTPITSDRHAVEINEDTGAANDDRITNDSDVRVRLVLDEAITLLADETLQVSANSGATWVNTTGSGTNWETLDNAVTLVEGAGDIIIRIIDTAGNSSKEVTLVNGDYTLDTNVTSEPTGVHTVGIDEDTGTVNDDRITNDDTVKITLTLGTSLILLADETLQVSADGGANWVDMTGAGTSWETADNSVDLQGGDAQTVTARIVDVAGNVTNIGLLNNDYKLDTTLLTTVTIDSISDDTGTESDDFVTNDSNGLTISATLSQALEADERLEYSADNGANWLDITASAIFDANGTGVTHADANLTSTTTAQMRVTDTAGNSSAIASQDVIIDVTPPTTTVASIDSISDDRGATSTDFITNDADGLTIAATLSQGLEAGEFVEYSIDGGISWTAVTGTTTGDTQVAFTEDGLTATATMRMRVTDTAGNSSAAVDQLVTIDTTAPTTAIATIDSISTDTGMPSDTMSNTDFITNDGDGLTIAATLNQGLEADEFVEYSIDGGISWTAVTGTTTGDTQVAFTEDGLTATATVQMRVTDTAGNSSADVSQLVTIDTTAPTTAVFSIDSISTDTGTESDDFITNDANGLTVTATLSQELQPGEFLEYSIDGVNWIDITTLASFNANNIEFSYLDTNLTTTATVQMRVTDVAGNTTLAASQLVTIDTILPTVTIAIDSIAPDTGIDNNDFITKFGSQGVTFYMTLSESLGTLFATGHILEYRKDGVNWTNVTSGMSGSGSNLSYTDSQLTGSATVEFRFTDAAGNSGQIASQTVTLDNTPPITAVATIDSISNDTGAFNADFITNDSDGLTVAATLSQGLQADEHVEYSIDNGANWTLVTGVNAGDTQLTFTEDNLTATATVQVRVTDTAGNTSASVSRTVTIDTTPPTTVATIDSISDDTGISSTDFVTNDSNGLTLTATLNQGLELNEFVEYSLDNGASWTQILGIAVGDTQLTFTEGGLTTTATVQIRVTDTAGNSGQISSQLITIDTATPATTVVTIDSISNDTGASNTDFITNDSDGLTVVATLSQGLQAGEHVEYSIDNGANWTLVTGVNAGDTQFTFTEDNLTATATVQVRVTDTAGNSSAAISQNVIIDTAAPTTEVASIDSISDDTGVSSTDFVTNDSNGLTLISTLSQGLQADEHVEYSIDNGASWTQVLGVAVGDTQVTTVATNLTSTATVQMRVTDTAGNSSAITSQLVTIDTTIPTSSIVTIDSISEDTGTDGDFITNDVDGLTFSVSLNQGLQTGEFIEYSIDNGVSWTDATNVTSAGTSVTFDATNLTSTATVQIRISDTAGNSSNVVSQLVTIDTTPPTAAPAGTHTIDIVEDTGATNDDRITNDDRVEVTLNLGSALTLAVGERLEVSADGGTTWVEATGAGTIWATANNAVSLLNGTNMITARIVNGAGNFEELTLTSGDYTLDMVAPTTTVTISGISRDTGVQGDFVTSDADGLTAIATLSAELEQDEVLEYSIDEGNTWIEITSVISADFSVTFTVPGLTSTATLEVRVRDLAGNVGATSEQLIVISPVGYIIEGQAADDYSGHSVASAGDVNGDGLDDIIVGAYGADSATEQNAGKSYVVFGRTEGATIPLSDVEAGTGGFVINGEAADDWSGRSVSSAGDVNGDGFDDLIVGARQASTTSRNFAGKSYIVFGKADGTAVDLSAVAQTLNNSGFVINGEASEDFSGWSVSSAGDVNGDGLDDVVIGAWEADPNGNVNSGKSYVVFGKTDGAEINLTDVLNGTGGFAIIGTTGGDASGWSVSSAGDINNDGLDDVIIGAHGADLAGSPDAGRSYVVFGKSATGTVNLSDIVAGTGGFVINGEAGDDQSGYSVSSAGDVNGDGIDDLIIGTRFADPSGGSNAGKSYVVFGKTSNTNAINLSDISAGTGGFVINGEATADRSGHSVSSAGDVNGDGFDDLIIGAPYADVDGNADAGKSYIVFGKGTNTDAIDLSDIVDGIGGFVINGDVSDDKNGFSVSSAGDVNGDGLDDLIIGAQHADVGGNGDAGKSYVVFGKTDTNAVELSAFGGDSPHSVDFAATVNADNHTGSTSSEIILGGEGDDTLTGGGGTDVILGGMGDDTILINASNLAALQAGFDADAKLLARVDGGGGIDTLQFMGTTDLTLDLTNLADNRVENFEIINLSGADHTVNISTEDLLDLGGIDIFNDGNGWTGLGAAVSRHQLLVQGEGGDTVDVTGLTNTGNTASDGTNTYRIYQDSGVQLLIDTDITVI